MSVYEYPSENAEETKTNFKSFSFSSEFRDDEVYVKSILNTGSSLESGVAEILSFAFIPHQGRGKFLPQKAKDLGVSQKEFGILTKGNNLTL